ncbi:ISAs1 family transposase [Roseofilum casamattae]|uniref:ISAs1 family transposase n=1 Tax=Roseofilum casamattae BLCC-M143 TaxID=3022442 RepID=A0ABT7BTB1_9CYAN|nr:ISAs1 family transposase [Roseofilum casamattae]MDJ1181774.1 ISAs1 family transposase [Roseofilum casamattae BLCC-M143]
MAQGFAPSLQSDKTDKSISTTTVKSVEEIQAGLLSCVEQIEDPRTTRTQKHGLKDIIVIAILAIISGAEGWEDIENYGLSKSQWLSEFLDLPHGIPSDDTFRRVFERINPSELEQALQQWLQPLLGSLVGEVVPIDGKTLRGSYDRQKEIKALNLVTAWASQQQLVLGQIPVDDKSNEITAIPALLELLDITGAIITIDAMGTQTEIVRRIQEKKADYVLSLKKNHPTLHAEVKQKFNQIKTNSGQSGNIDYNQGVGAGHHRREKRRVWAIPVTEFESLYQSEQWVGLQTIVVVERTRHLWNKTTHEVQLYLSSLPANARVLGNIIRQHWGIENQVHWTLDVTFNEDSSRIRSGHSPQNLALLRRWALNALRQETTLKRSLRQKQKRAAMNNDYMFSILSSFCQG